MRASVSLLASLFILDLISELFYLHQLVANVVA